MEPRMLDKINGLNALRRQREKVLEDINSTTDEILNEIKEIVQKSGIPGYMLVNIGNSMKTPF